MFYYTHNFHFLRCFPENKIQIRTLCDPLDYVKHFQHLIVFFICNPYTYCICMYANYGNCIIEDIRHYLRQKELNS